jgi:hypothetical protein
VGFRERRLRSVYLTAHHVVSPATQREGVNALLYLHGDQAWEHLWPPDIPRRNPGTLRAQSISVSPPGNRVRSFLDIVAPDDVRWEDVHVGLMEVVGRCQIAPLPWSGQSRGGTYFEIGMDVGLSARWQKELAILYRAAQALWLAQNI